LWRDVELNLERAAACVLNWAAKQQQMKQIDIYLDHRDTRVHPAASSGDVIGPEN
jgi:hypothetical protein